MPRYRLEIIAQLARQMEFAPHDVRVGQLAAAESLLHLLDPTKAYPLDFITYRITGYRPKVSKTELLTGIALQHDLGLLIESVSDTLDLHAGCMPEPVLAIDDVCERFNVTSKTIQRWRRKGLPARRFVFADGKRRVGFLLSSVERFVGAHQEQVAPISNFSQINEAERTLIVRHARRLAVACGCGIDEITHRVAARTNRSPLTILHTLRKHDHEHPGEAILPGAASAVAEPDRVAMLKALRRGAGIVELSARYGRPRSTVYRAVMTERVHRLLKRKVRFHDDLLFHERDAEGTINAIVAQEELADEPSREELRVPRDLPPYLQALYRTPLLTKSRERALFLKLNFHKYQFVQARRRRLDPESSRHRGLCLLESYLAKAAETKNAIVRANLRLVVSIARKHLRGNLGLLELVSEGNVTLMRAVDSFDVGRGHRFSTYATFALMKGFARSVPQMLTASRRAAAGDDAMLAQVADRHDGVATDRFVQRDQVERLLSGLDARERSVVAAHYGLDGAAAGGATYEQVGQRLGLSKERVRQIEQCALAKLRAAALSGNS